MNNFTYFNPTRIHFGKGQIAKLAEEIPSDAKVLITYGGGSIKKNGVLDQVRCALADHARLFEFGGIEANPACETLDQAIALHEKIEAFLQQQITERVSMDESLGQLTALFD